MDLIYADMARCPPPHVTLEQWRALVAVVDAGGYAQAAEALHKSQSAVTYAVQKLESQLGVEGVRDRGPQGRADADRPAPLPPRARAARRGGRARSSAARALSAGWEAQIRLAVEILFPTWLLLQLPRPLRRREPAHAHRSDRVGAGRHRRSAAAGPGRPRDLAAGAAGLPGRSADALPRDSGRASGASAAPR